MHLNLFPDHSRWQFELPTNLNIKTNLLKKYGVQKSTETDPETSTNVLVTQEDVYDFGFHFANSTAHTSYVSLLQAQGGKDKDWWKKAESIYEFTVKDIDGNDVCLDKYKYVNVY